MTNPDSSVGRSAGRGHPAELVEAFDSSDEAWQYWWLQPEHVRDLYSSWVREGRSAQARRRRAAHTADYAARGVLLASVQPRRARPLTEGVTTAAKNCLVVSGVTGLSWLAVTAAAGSRYQWSQLVGMLEIAVGLTAAPAVRDLWRHRRAPVARSPHDDVD